LNEFETGNKKMNEIIKVAVDSAVAQQAKADYDFYDPLLEDPDSVPEVPNPSMRFYEELDDDGRAFYNADGTPMEVDVNGPEGFVYSSEAE